LSNYKHPFLNVYTTAVLFLIILGGIMYKYYKRHQRIKQEKGENKMKSLLDEMDWETDSDNDERNKEEI
jgi:hypothetical protein